jgi:hypothetical protein
VIIPALAIMLVCFGPMIGAGVAREEAIFAGQIQVTGNLPSCADIARLLSSASSQTIRDWSLAPLRTRLVMPPENIPARL